VEDRVIRGLVTLQDQQVLGLREQARRAGGQRDGRPELRLSVHLRLRQPELDRELDQRKDCVAGNGHRLRVDHVGGDGRGVRDRPPQRQELAGDPHAVDLRVNRLIDARPELVRPRQGVSSVVHSNPPITA
jgi:hypothetical protein